MVGFSWLNFAPEDLRRRRRMTMNRRRMTMNRRRMTMNKICPRKSCYRYIHIDTHTYRQKDRQAHFKSIVLVIWDFLLNKTSCGEAMTLFFWPGERKGGPRRQEGGGPFFCWKSQEGGPCLSFFSAHDKARKPENLEKVGALHCLKVFVGGGV